MYTDPENRASEVLVHLPKLLALFWLWSLSALPAFSSNLVWNLVNVTGPDGAIFSGSFAYDAGANSYSAMDITITPGPIPADGGTTPTLG